MYFSLFIYNFICFCSKIPVFAGNCSVKKKKVECDVNLNVALNIAGDMEMFTALLLSNECMAVLNLWAHQCKVSTW